MAASLLSAWWSPPGHLNVPITMLSGESQATAPAPVAFAEEAFSSDASCSGTTAPLPYHSHTYSLPTSFPSTGQEESYLKTQHLLQKLQT